MAFQYTDFENKILDLVTSTTSSRFLSNRLVLGGISGSGGGGGGPWVPPIGQLRQTDVCYDLSEVATSTIPVSGRSLLDNLNRIRFGTTIRPGYTPVNYTSTTSGTLLQHLTGLDDKFTSVSGVVTTGHIHSSLSAADGSPNPAWDIGASGAVNTVVVFRKTADSTTGWQIQDQDGNVIVNVDSVNNRVGINDADPGEPFDVNGNINTTGVLKVDDIQVVSNQQPHIDDATDAATAITRINAILVVLETHGLVASS